MTLKQTTPVKSRLILWAACLMLVFGAGLVSAQICDQEISVCVAGNFCDGDGDCFIRDHRRCRNCPGERDCDDDVWDPDNACGADPAATYTAGLTGAFVFSDEAGNPVVMNMFSNSGGDQLVQEVPPPGMWMSRPSEILPQQAWDNAFSEGCPELGDVQVDQFFSFFDSWSILGHGDQARINLTTHILDAEGTEWEIWIQLVAEEQTGVPFLPSVGDGPSTFPLSTVWVWGKPATKKGRKSLCDDEHRPLLPAENVLTITAVP